MKAKIFQEKGEDQNARTELLELESTRQVDLHKNDNLFVIVGIGLLFVVLGAGWLGFKFWKKRKGRGRAELEKPGDAEQEPGDAELEPSDAELEPSDAELEPGDGWHRPLFLEPVSESLFPSVFLQNLFRFASDQTLVWFDKTQCLIGHQIFYSSICKSSV